MFTSTSNHLNWVNPLSMVHFHPFSIIFSWRNRNPSGFSQHRSGAAKPHPGPAPGPAPVRTWQNVRWPGAVWEAMWGGFFQENPLESLEIQHLGCYIRHVVIKTTSWIVDIWHVDLYSIFKLRYHIWYHLICYINISDMSYPTWIRHVGSPQFHDVAKVPGLPRWSCAGRPRRSPWRCPVRKLCCGWRCWMK